MSDKVKILSYYGGCGMSYFYENSKFKIVWTERGREREEIITGTTTAQNFYDFINTEKAMWGGYMFSDLVEAHHYIDPDDKIQDDESPF